MQDLTHRFEGFPSKPICNTTGRLVVSDICATPTCPECREVEARRRGDFARDMPGTFAAWEVARQSAINSTGPRGPSDLGTCGGPVPGSDDEPSDIGNDGPIRGAFDRRAVRSALQSASECTGDGPLVEHRDEAGHTILACCDPTCAWCQRRLERDDDGEFKVVRWRKLSETPKRPDFTTWLGFVRELRMLGRTVVLLAKMRTLAWLKHRRAQLERKP